MEGVCEKINNSEEFENEERFGSLYDSGEIFSVYQARYKILTVLSGTTISETQSITYDTLADEYKKQTGEALKKDELYYLFGTRKPLTAMLMMDPYLMIENQCGPIKLKLKMPLENCLEDVQRFMEEDCSDGIEIQNFEQFEIKNGVSSDELQEKLREKAMIYCGIHSMKFLSINDIEEDEQSSENVQDDENSEDFSDYAGDFVPDDEYYERVNKNDLLSKSVNPEEEKLLKLEFKNLEIDYFQTLLPVEKIEQLKKHCPTKKFEKFQAEIDRWKNHEKDNKIYYEQQFQLIKKNLPKNQEKYFEKMKKLIDEIVKDKNQRQKRYDQLNREYLEVIFKKFIPNYKQ